MLPGDAPETSQGLPPRGRSKVLREKADSQIVVGCFTKTHFELWKSGSGLHSVCTGEVRHVNERAKRFSREISTHRPEVFCTYSTPPRSRTRDRLGAPATTPTEPMYANGEASTRSATQAIM
eukprot:scaffold225105_cov32-Tisochrysis_lutea.AAC.2